VIDDELGRKERVDSRRVPVEPAYRVTHGSEIDDRRHTGEVLEEHASRPERDLVVRLGDRVPRPDRIHLVGAPEPQRIGSEHVLEQDPQRIGQTTNPDARLESIEWRDQH
jgi:hypothetical protein